MVVAFMKLHSSGNTWKDKEISPQLLKANNYRLLYAHKKRIEWWQITQEGVSGSVDLEGHPEEVTSESRPEEWKVRGIPKTGETVSRHREGRVQSLKSEEKSWLIQETERRPKALVHKKP